MVIIDMITLMKKKRQMKVMLVILQCIVMIGQQVNNLRKSTVIWSPKRECIKVTRILRIIDRMWRYNTITRNQIIWQSLCLIYLLQ